MHGNIESSDSLIDYRVSKIYKENCGMWTLSDNNELVFFIGLNDWMINFLINKSVSKHILKIIRISCQRIDCSMKIT